MQRPGIGWLGLLLGAAIIAAGQYVGRYVEAAATAGGPEAWQAGLSGLLFLFYRASVPLGLGVAAVCTAFAARVGWRVILVIVAATAAVWYLTPWTYLPPFEPTALMYGLAGAAIALMLLLSFWFYARARSGLSGLAGWAADLRLLGLIFLGGGIWLLCGLASFPAYSLQPDKAAMYKTLPMAKEMFMDLTAYLLLGFFFSMLGQIAGHRAAKAAAAQPVKKPAQKPVETKPAEPPKKPVEPPKPAVEAKPVSPVKPAEPPKPAPAPPKPPEAKPGPEAKSVSGVMPGAAPKTEVVEVKSGPSLAKPAMVVEKKAEEALEAAKDKAGLTGAEKSPNP
ncbi:MAG: hypothetical protein AB1814_17235 [Thermodesulfobacteriota bacterium]